MKLILNYPWAHVISICKTKKVSKKQQVQFIQSNFFTYKPKVISFYSPVLRLRSLQRRETTSSIIERRKQVSKRALITSWIQNSPFHREHITYWQNLRWFLTPIRWPRPVILIRRLIAKQGSLTFSLEAIKFCLVLRSTPAVPIQIVFRLRINTFLGGKIILLFHQKTALCWVLIFFRVKMKLSC